jgi:uncharacterized protein Yka (UPF0111/DUF47 family)
VSLFFILKNERGRKTMAKRVQAVEEKVGLIAQAQEEYEEIVEEVQGYCQKARELRKQADELRRSGSTDPQMATQIRQLLEQADYFDQLADQKDGHPRLEALRRINDLQREAFAVKATISHNESVLIRQRRELEQTREEAAAMIRRAEERVQETERLLSSELAKLEALEGKQV